MSLPADRSTEQPFGAADCAIIIEVNEGTSTQRADATLVAATVLVLAASGLVLLFWADAREYSDNQRNWALMGGWAGLGTAGVVALLGLATFVRRRGSRLAELAFAAGLGVVSTALLIVATLAS